MTVRLRLALAALWLAAPGAALAQRAHEPPSLPPAAAQVAPAPAPSGDDAFVFQDDAVEHDAMWFDGHELLAFGYGDDFDLDSGDLDGGGDLMAMAQSDLSDVQREQLRALHEANARKGVQRRADMQLARMDLHELLRADKPELGAINAQIDKVARLRADGMKSAVETRLQARAVLTPEQLKSLRSPMRPMLMQHDMLDGSEPPKH